MSMKVFLVKSILYKIQIFLFRNKTFSFIMVAVDKYFLFITVVSMIVCMYNQRYGFRILGGAARAQQWILHHFVFAPIRVRIFSTKNLNRISINEGMNPHCRFRSDYYSVY